MHSSIYSDRYTALRYAADRGLEYNEDDRVHTKHESEFKNVCYPKMLDKYVKGYITHVKRLLLFHSNSLKLTIQFIYSQTENVGRFWFQPSKYLNEIRKIFDEINNPNSDLEPYFNESDVTIGQVLAAVYPGDNDEVEYYRAKIIHIENDKKTQQTIFEVRH